MQRVRVVMSPETVLLGAGGHGVVVTALAMACGIRPTGVIDPRNDALERVPEALWVEASDEAVFRFEPREVRLLNGVGTNRPATVRAKIFETFRERGYAFPTLVHPYSWTGLTVELGEGVQVMAGAVVQPRTRIGANSIVN